MLYSDRTRPYLVTLHSNFRSVGRKRANRRDNMVENFVVPNPVGNPMRLLSYYPAIELLSVHCCSRREIRALITSAHPLTVSKPSKLFIKSARLTLCCLCCTPVRSEYTVNTIRDQHSAGGCDHRGISRAFHATRS